MTKQILTLGIVLSSMVLSGCAAYNNLVYDQKHIEWETQTPDTFPVLNAVGYAPIEKQSGDSAQVKDLNAMRASKLAAYRELAEQVYGNELPAAARWKTGR